MPRTSKKSPGKSGRSKVAALKSHPFAELLPRMSETELGALLDDIFTNGQRDPIVLFEGQILDGRNRYACCHKLGRRPITIKFKGSESDALNYVYSKAVHRNMTDSQKAASAVNFLATFEKAAKSRMKSGGTEPVPEGQKGESREKAGGLFGVSGRYVSDAKAILDADPKLFQQVFEGRLFLTRAKRQIVRSTRVAAAKAATKSGRLVDPSECIILVGDVLKESEKLERSKFRLVFADPPYNLGFKYFDDPTHDALAPIEYSKRTGQWIKACADLLTHDGTLCWMIPEEHVADSRDAIVEAGLHIRRLIVWHESFGQAGSNNFGRTCRFIWYATKSKTDFVFDAGAILIESKRASVYGDKRAAAGGKVPDALWDFARVAGTFKERIPDEGIPTQLPVALVERAVRCFTEPGDAVLDPFGGTGTTARAALRCGRRVVLIERSKRYAKIARREVDGMPTKKES